MSKKKVLSELKGDLLRARTRAKRVSKPVAYKGCGLKTYTDVCGNEVPLPLDESIIRDSPRLLQDVTMLWRERGINIMSQQFVALHGVIGATLSGCRVRQQENEYMLNLQIVCVGGAGSGKSSLAKLDYLIKGIDAELRQAYAARLDDYRREMQLYNLELVQWREKWKGLHAEGTNGSSRSIASSPTLPSQCPLPPKEPLPRCLLMADAVTGAALVYWLAGNDGYITLLRHDELTTLKNAIEDRYGNFPDIVKKGFDNSKHEKQLRGDNEGYYIHHVGLALVLSSTPGVLRSFLGSYEDGMGSRLLGHFTASAPRYDEDLSDEQLQLFNQSLKASAEQVYELYHAVKEWHEQHTGHHLTLWLSASQRSRMAHHFNRILKYYVAMENLGEEATPIIRRRAVDTKRIMMILALCRLLEELYRDSAGHVFLPDDGRLPVTDDDFQSVLNFGDYLINHSIFMYYMVVGQPREDEERPRQLSPAEHFRLLSNTFTANDVILIGESHDVKRRTCYRRINKWQGMEMIKDRGNSVFEKTSLGRAFNQRRSSSKG